MQRINFYRQRVAINVLAKDIANAREIYDAAEGHAVIGVLSAQFTSVEQGIAEVRRWMAEVPSISVGLGAGDPAQFYKAAMIAAKLHPAHVNQTFTGSGFAAGALAATGGQQTFINALVSPSGTPGEVRISTGVRSAKGIPAQVSCDAAVRMMQDMGAHAAKFFPMGGEKSLAELKA
nr:2-dehydro-3-deoxy-phosphogluconate aldolase [Klebsiella aerogenes]